MGNLSRKTPWNSCGEQFLLCPKLEWKTSHCIPRIEGIPDWWGTAVNVQSMVFGNMGDTSATGVAFTETRQPAKTTFMANGCPTQGEDVVAGIRYPQPDQ